MLLGIDVGGTHTDAVLLRVEGGQFSVVAGVKTPTDHSDVAASVAAALEAVLAGRDAAQVSRFTLSTTLTTNALAQKQFDDALLVLVPGPGMDVGEWSMGVPVRVLAGSIDHRGRETSPLDEQECAALVTTLQEENIRTVAIAGKFAIRNPEHELRLGRMVREGATPDYVCVSHKLSGRLNFPRRAMAAFYNAAIWRLHNTFADAVALAAHGVGNGREPLLLMAHGGSVPLGASRENCVEAANSGPAASVLGVMALEGKNLSAHETVLFCDIGGSTTDIALMAKGSPVTAREGLTLGGRRTSTPGLAACSVPVGGDSPLSVDANGALVLETVRKGPCLAMGGPLPALTDALNVIGDACWGDTAASLRGMENIAETMSRATGGTVTAVEAARGAAALAATRIRDAAREFVATVNAHPVYTVAQLLEGVLVKPERMCVVGGAGASMAATLENILGLPATVPGHAALANAIGAALARVSVFAALYADTARRVAQLLPDGESFAVGNAYTLDEAAARARAVVRERAAALDPDARGFPVEMVESDCFAMHDEYGGRAGRTIRVVCRVKPGLITELTL